jgi:hypothetical protein
MLKGCARRCFAPKTDKHREERKMTYNFQDEPNPSMPTEVTSTGSVYLVDGTPQGDLLTSAFSGRTIAVSVVPPHGWSLDFVRWSNGGDGTFPVPAPGVEDVHPFSYAVSQNGTRLSGNGHFKIKKQTG